MSFWSMNILVDPWTSYDNHPPPYILLHLHVLAEKMETMLEQLQIPKVMRLEVWSRVNK